MFDAEDTLSSLLSSHAEQSDFYTSISSLLQSKLYHQLTVSILEFTSSPTNANIHDGNHNFLQLYEIITSLKSKLNPLMLARIAWNVSLSQSQAEKNDAASQTSILTDLLESSEMKSAPHAKLFTEAKLNLLSLSSSSSKLEHEQIKKFLKSNVQTLKELSSSTESEVAAVHSAYYQTAMELYKKVGPAEDFYKHCIQYLHFTPLGLLPQQDLTVLARDLCLAALVGNGVYNLGTVVYENGELLDKLKGTDDGYLVDLMLSAAEGDVAAVKNLELHKVRLEAQGCDMKVIQEKIMLLGLVNMVFERDSHERTIKFDDISVRLQVDAAQVEWIIMKALSLGLIQGSMDQVDGVVDVSYVMPRVLDENMMNKLAQRFGEWATKVAETREYMGEHIPAC